MDEVFSITAPTGLGIPDRTSGQQNLALAILFLFPSLALVVIIVRAAGRWSARQFGWDDGLICAAMFLSILETAASYKFIKTNYIGIRGVDIPPHDPIEPLVWTYAIQILYNPILALVKASVLIFLLRLFGEMDGVRPYVLALNTVNLLQMVAVLFANVFQCMPIERVWDPSVRGGQCLDRRILFVSTASFTILTDVLVLALPAWIFRGLNIPRRTKYALLSVFLLGGIVTAAGIARLVLLVIGLYDLVKVRDPTYNIGFVVSAIETNLALVTASAPALMPLFKSWFPKVFGSDGSTITGGRKVPLRDMKHRIQLVDRSPRGSEEQTMTLNGIAPASRFERNGSRV